MTTIEASVRVDSIQNVAVFCFLEKRINSASQIGSIQKAVATEIEQGKECLVFDFAGVEFVSSSMIGLLAEARQRLRTPDGLGAKQIDVFPDQTSAVTAARDKDEHQVQIALCSLAPPIEEVFKICGLVK